MTSSSATRELQSVKSRRRIDDPRFDNLHSNLVQANTELYEAGDRLDSLLSATKDAAGVLASGDGSR